jgi:hypothetical protein
MLSISSHMGPVILLGVRATVLDQLAVLSVAQSRRQSWSAGCRRASGRPLRETPKVLERRAYHFGLCGVADIDLQLGLADRDFQRGT